MLILGIHRDPYHNTGAAALLDDGNGVRVVAISEERLDRVKDSSRYPDNAIKYCLRELGAEGPADCDLIVSDYIFQPKWNGDRINGVRSALTFLKNTSQRLEYREQIPPGDVHFLNHHMAHACSAFYPSGFDAAAVLIVDGHGTMLAPGEKASATDPSGIFETQSLYAMKTGKIDTLSKTGVSGVGMLYAAFTQFLGFGQLQEGKTMGLAPHGAQSGLSHIKFPDHFDGIVTDYSELANIWAKKGKWVEDSRLIPCKNTKDQTNEYYSRIAYEVQEETDRAMLHLAEFAKRKTGSKNLCIAGGVGLNSVANQKISEAGIFENIWIQPAASDTGIPLGCALYGYYHLMGGDKPWRMDNAYLGREYTTEEIREGIAKYTDQVTLEEDVDYSRAARLLSDGKIVGWFHGACEYGPRSLGHRSILVDPRKSENKDLLNSRVKNREAFRPFAPSVILEAASEYFDLGGASPYMLLVASVRPEKRDIIPAITHVDNTARVQTVTCAENGLFYDLIHAFGELTGVPVVLNTSFNVAGEPIVETPEDAIKCFLGTEIDVLMLDNFLLQKKPR